MKFDYTDILNSEWNVGRCTAKSVEAVVWCGNVPVIAGIAAAYADHIVELHNAWLKTRTEDES